MILTTLVLHLGVNIIGSSSVESSKDLTPLKSISAVDSSLLWPLRKLLPLLLATMMLILLVGCFLGVDEATNTGRDDGVNESGIDDTETAGRPF